MSARPAAAAAGGILRRWQERRLPVLRETPVRPSRYARDVTAVVYTFPPRGREEEAFRRIECAVLQTWAVIGRLKTVVVAGRPFAALGAFASAHRCDVEVQVEPSLTPGAIASMSLDCIARLHGRFSTPYCLIIQDDGFPLRDTLGEFLGRWDYIGAPVVRDSLRRRVTGPLRMTALNGGFSLRSRRICEHAARDWGRFWHRIFPLNRKPSRFFAEDVFYTNTARLLPRFRREHRFPSDAEAFRFSVDLLDGLVTPPEGVAPFGFHGKHTGDRLLAGPGPASV